MALVSRTVPPLDEFYRLYSPVVQLNLLKRMLEIFAPRTCHVSGKGSEGQTMRTNPQLSVGSSAISSFITSYCQLAVIV